MNIKNTIVNVLISAAVSATALLVYHSFNQKVKIGYLKSGVLLQGYQEVKIADEQYAKEMKVAQDNVDTLKNRFERLQEAYDVAKNEGARNSIAMKLGAVKYEFEKYNEQASMQLEQRKQEMTKKVLDNINNYVQEYGKNHGYNYIFGTTNEGSLLYGDEANDLTDIILKEMNEKYAGAKK